MKIRAILAATVLLSACSQKPKQAITHIVEWSMTPCAAEIDGAVMGKLVDVSLRSPQETIADMDRYDHRLRCIKEWADTLKDPCVRDSYHKWVESFQRGSARDREKLNKPYKEVEESEYEARDRRIRAYERQNPIPAPPPDACERSLIEKVKP